MDVLRRDWGFDGAVVTDWGGSNDHALGVKNGSTLEMPAPGGDAIRELMKAVQTGKITEADVDARLEELLERLGDPAFLRCHNSFAVSLDHAAVFRRESFLMKGGTVVPISHGYYPAVREQFRKYHHIEL